MDRRSFLAVGATALLAGCGGDGDTETPTDEDDDNDNQGSTDTPENGGSTATDRSSPTPGGTGEFDPEITWNSCTSFTIEAESYTAVYAALADNSVSRFEEGYSGSNTFETENSINSIEIYSDSGQYTGYNPDAAECREDE